MKKILCILILAFLFSCSPKINEKDIFKSFGIDLPNNYTIITREQKEAIGDSYNSIEIKISDEEFNSYLNYLPKDRLVLTPQGDYFIYKKNKNENEYLTISKAMRTITYINIEE